MEFKRSTGKSAHQAREEQNPSVLATDQESQKLFTVLCNYISLAQFELARSVIDELFLLSPEKVVRVLRALVLSDIPTQWIFSESVPTGAHLAWLSFVEYRNLFRRVQDGGTEEEENLKSWQQVSAKLKKTAINPLGFVSHSRFSVQVMEAKELRLFDKEQFTKGPAATFHVRVQCEGKRIETSENDNVDNPSWDGEDLPFRMLYADSKVEFIVIAKRPLDRRNTSSGEDVGVDVIGRCELPLHQLRSKQEYHIWIPLDKPTPLEEDEVVQTSTQNESNVAIFNNPWKLGTGRNTGLSQVSKHEYGKIRVKFSWTHGQATLAGRFPTKTIRSLESDLLLFNALYNSRKAYFARIRGDEDAMPSGNNLQRLPQEKQRRAVSALGDGEVMMIDDDLDGTSSVAVEEHVSSDGLLMTGTLNDDDIDGFQLRKADPVLAWKNVVRLREYCFYLLSDTSGRNPVRDIVLKGELPEAFLSDDVFRQLRLVIRSVPPAAHALISRLHDLQRESSLSRDVSLAALSQPTKFQSLYATCIAESLLKKEFNKAADTAHVLFQEIYTDAKRNDLMDDVLTGIITYIHRQNDEPGKSQQSLLSLLSKYSSHLGMDERSLIDRSVLDGDEVEMNEFSNERIVKQQQEKLYMQAASYSRLLGTNEEYTLRRFCQLEDNHVYGGNDLKKTLPLIFLTFHRALDTLNKIFLGRTDATSADELRGQQEQCHAAFFAEYYSFIRVTGQHVFQYIIRKTLGYLKGRQWKEAGIAIRPFSQLRPLVILIAWDEFEDDFFAREELIVHLWRNRPAFPPDSCSEPRLTQWCNRLDFNVKLINSVLDYSYPNLDTATKNDRAIRLLDTLRLHSILYTFRDHIPQMPPHVLLDLLSPDNFMDEPERGRECEHDVHVLRSYYAIRSVIGLMLGDLKDPVIEKVEKLAAEELEKAKKGGDETDAESEVSAMRADKLFPDDDENSTRDPVTDINAGTVLETTQKYIVGMKRVEFQVTTLEKIFCMLFMQHKDLAAEDRKKFEDLREEYKTEQFQEEAEINKEMGKGDNEKTKAALLELRKDDESPMVVDTAKCTVLLDFVKDTIAKVQERVQRDHSNNPDPKLMSNFARLNALRLFVDEGVWRMTILRQRGMQPTMELLVAPMESISNIFLKLDKIADHEKAFSEDSAGLASGRLTRIGQLGNVVTAQRWLQLCAIVRDKTRRKGKSGVQEAVLEFVSNFYKDPEVSKGTGGNGDNLRVMQGFFFVMDVAIAFGHVLTTKQYDDLLDSAISFLQHTRPSHVTPSEVELYNFYLSYAKHCRQVNRNRFRLAEAYDLAKMPDVMKSSSGDGMDGDEAKADSDPNALTYWVNAYRLTTQLKKNLKGKNIVNGGWLMNETDRPQSEVSARLYPSYITAYEDYCHQLGIAMIADEFPTTSSEDIDRMARVSEDGPNKEGYEKVAAGRMSPWESLDVMKYLLSHAEDAEVEEDATKQRVVPADAPLKERLFLVAHRVGLLAKRILPSLSAIRYGIRAASTGIIKDMCSLAREQSKFLPTYSRWTDWRLTMYENTLRLVVADESGSFDLPATVRAMLTNENLFQDQEAHIRLLEAFLDSDDISHKEMRKALEVCDLVVNADPSVQARSEAVLQTLLVRIIEDPSHADHLFRSNCILRLLDMSWAARLALKHVDDWESPQLALPVLLKCVTDIKATHPLRPKLAFKYNTVLIFSEMRETFTEDEAREYLEYRERENPDITQQEALSVLNLFQSWKGFEVESYKDLSFVLLTLLDAKRVRAATKLFELWRTSNHMEHEFNYPLDEKIRPRIYDLIEAASISLFFTKGSKTKDRIAGFRRLRKVPNDKMLFIGRALVGYLVDNRSRFVVIEFIESFINDQDRVTSRLSQRDLLTYGGDAGVASVSDEYRRWLRLMKTSSMMLLQLPAALQDELLEFYRKPREIVHVLLQRGEVELVAKAYPHFMKYNGDVVSKTKEVGPPTQEGELSDRARRLLSGGEGTGGSGGASSFASKWDHDDEERLQFVQVNDLITQDDFSPTAFILRFALEVLELEHSSMGKDIGFALFDMVFAEEDRSKQRRNKLGETGQTALERAEEVIHEKGQYVLVGNVCLEAVNGLSSKLGEHDHALFVVHLMKNILTYYKAKLEPRLKTINEDDFNRWRAAHSSTRETSARHEMLLNRLRSVNMAMLDLEARYNAYRNLVFTEHEISQIDQKALQSRSNNKGGPPKLPILYALRRVRFCLDDLADEGRAADLRQRLIEVDKIDLAKRVWSEIEGRDPEDFTRDVQSKASDVADMVEKFDTIPKKKPTGNIAAIADNIQGPM